MRFPWLQVGADVISAKAGDLGVLLGCSRREAMGLLVDLWAWVLTRSPDDAPPDGIVRDSRTGTGAVPATERAVSWAGPEGMLVTALEELGFVERLPDGLRFRGAARYAATWQKNQRRKQTDPKPGRNRTGTGEEPARKTQTHTHIEASASQAPADAAPPLLVVQEAAPEKPKRGPNTTAMGEFIDWARGEVKPRLPPDAVDPAAGMKPHERVRLGEAVKDHGLETVKAAFRLFMGWQPAQSKGYSVGFFANQWEGWVRQAKATPEATSAQPKPKMRVL